MRKLYVNKNKNNTDEVALTFFPKPLSSQKHILLKNGTVGNGKIADKSMIKRVNIWK